MQLLEIEKVLTQIQGLFRLEAQCGAAEALR